MHGALYALRILARKYEFRGNDEEERQPLADIVNTTMPVGKACSLSLSLSQPHWPRWGR